MDPINPYPTLNRNGSQNLILHSPEMDTTPNMKVHTPILISNTFEQWLMQILHFPLMEYETISHSGFALMGHLLSVGCIY